MLWDGDIEPVSKAFSNDDGGKKRGRIVLAFPILKIERWEKKLFTLITLYIT